MQGEPVSAFCPFFICFAFPYGVPVLGTMDGGCVLTNYW